MRAILYMRDSTIISNSCLGVCCKSGGGFHGPYSSCSAVYGCARIPVDTLDASSDWCPALQQLPNQSGGVVPMHALQ